MKKKLIMKKCLCDNCVYRKGCPQAEKGTIKCSKRRRI